jgi:hypothetical protein
MNPHRGDYVIRLSDQEVRGRLTLGLLSELQAALEVRTLQQLTARLIDPSADDTAVFIAAMSGSAITADEVKAWPLMDAMSAMQQIGQVFEAAFAPPEGEQSKGKPEKKSPSRGVTGSASASA